MRIKGFILFLLLLGLTSPIAAQIDVFPYDNDEDLIKEKDSLIPHWKYINRGSFDISEVAFVNWNAGGASSISGLLGLEVQRNYQKGHVVWNNRAHARFGMNKQQEQELRKTDDLLELNSSFGYRTDTLSNWFFSANFNFKTQFAKGYNYSNSDNKAISKFMAPAYMFLGAGTAYGEHIETFSLYLSPLTLKSTFVLDQDLADAGSFGVKPAIYDEFGNKISDGEMFRREIGILITSSYNTTLFDNVTMQNKLGLYTDYFNNFGNIDVDWEMVLNFKVNDFIRTVFSTHLLYDDDVKTTQDTVPGEEPKVSGARVQLKQTLGVGVLVDF